jgi:uncharacterized membrane protein HdeD (DUF308 family)
MKTRNTNRNIIVTGILLLLSGIITAIMAVESSLVLRYMHAGVLGSAGVFALITGQEYKTMNGRSKYYTSMGLIVITLTMALGIFGTSAATFANTLGFFLLLLGTVGFAFAQHLLIDREAGSNLAGMKFLVGMLIAIGGAWILTIPDTHTNIAFLVSGSLFVLTGLALIQLGRMTGIEKKIEHPGI